MMKIGELISTVLAASMALVLFSSCTAASVDSGKRPMEDSNIVAGPGEKTFNERYGLRLALPMDEKAFLGTLDRLKLRYELYGQRGSEREMPKPRRSAIDMSRIIKCYQIYGDLDVKRGVGAVYRSYVDEKNRVVYIENTFDYTGP